MTSKAPNVRYTRPTKSKSYLEENQNQVPFPQLMAHAYLGTKDSQTDGTIATEDQNLTGLYNLTGGQVRLFIKLLGMLPWRIEKDEATQKGRHVTEVRIHHENSKLRLPYIELKSMGALVSAITGDKKPRSIQYEAVKRDLLALDDCSIRWKYKIPGTNGETIRMKSGLVMVHEDASGVTLGLYFHPIVLETERFLTLPPTIFDEVKRMKGGRGDLPDYYYRLILLVALHGGRGTKPYNKRIPDLIKELGLDRLEGRRMRRGKEAAQKLLEEALAILSNDDIGLIGKYSIDERMKVVRWETGRRGRAQGATTQIELEGEDLLRIANS